MADVENIRRGLAALLRTVLPADQGHVSPYFDAAISTTCLQVAGIERMAPSEFGGKSWTFTIEGVFALNVEPKSQKILDGLVETVAAALESDSGASGALTSRLLEDGTTETGQPAAAEDVTFIEYRGAVPEALKNGTTVLVATWAVEVLT
jgi:hypothetical protein